MEINFVYLVFFILLLPVLLASLIYWWLNRKGYRFLGLLIFVSIIGAEFYAVYTAFYPHDSFYKDDFEYCTKLKFPGSGKIIAKDVEYPDFHGAYSLDALVYLSESDFNSLLDTVKKDQEFKIDTAYSWRGTYFEQVTKGVDMNNVDKVFVVQGVAAIGFFNDNKTIVFEKMPY
jgi:hypothetical protein